jgi:predicted heme/steroid binding protein
MEPKKNKISLIQIDRTSAWVLLASILAYMLSGYGMTKGIFDSQVARFMHRNILPTITMVAFVGHTSLAVRAAMMRKRIWNKVTKIILITTYVAGFLIFLYLEVFIMRDYTTLQKIVTTNTKVVSDNNRGDPPPSELIIENDQQRVFTLEELAKYNGKNGFPAYAAVDGVVYDLTSVFENGKHYEHSAGQELTNAFYKKHAISEITKYSIVGVLEKE